MAIKRYRPTTPGQRHKTGVIFKELTEKKPLKKLTKGVTKKKSGRTASGKITTRHKGGRRKRRVRVIDFKRDKKGIPARVSSIEYDPNRSAFIALLTYKDGEKRYILAPEGLKIGDEVLSGENAEIKVGNALPLKKIPSGSPIHNIELKRGKGGQIVRSAGSSATLLSKEEKFAQVKLPSREIRLIHTFCYATLGQVSNIEHGNIKLGKAGRSRLMGRRPTVRGVVMPPSAHPHGGGEGKAGTGRPPKTVYGKRAFGKTRKKGKPSDKYIVKRRKTK